MSRNDGYVSYVLELLAPLGCVVARRMFGGHGVYCDELFIAIVQDDTLWLKADEDTRASFECADCRIFTYSRAGKTATLNFFSAPADAIDSPEALLPWARLALTAALRRNTKNRRTAARTKTAARVRRRSP